MVTTYNFNPGLLYDAGLGYKIMLRKHLGIKFQVGYNFKEVRGDVLMEGLKTGTVSQKRNSGASGCGFVF